VRHRGRFAAAVSGLSRIRRWYSSPDTHIVVYDLTDILNPQIAKEIVVPGHFMGARLIEGIVYLITTQYSYDFVYLDEDELIVPKIMVDGDVKEIPIDDVNYIDSPDSSAFTNIVSVNINDDSKEVDSKMFLIGNSQILYV